MCEPTDLAGLRQAERGTQQALMGAVDAAGKATLLRAFELLADIAVSLGATEKAVEDLLDDTHVEPGTGHRLAAAALRNGLASRTVLDAEWRVRGLPAATH